MSEHGIYRGTLLTLADGQQSRFGLTSRGGLRVSMEDANGNPIGGTGTAANQVQGTSASGATDDGSNPVKIGGYAHSGFPPAAANGQRVHAWHTRNGAYIMGGINLGAGGDTMGLVTAVAPADNPTGVALLGVGGYSFNGSTWARSRGDTTGTWVKSPPLSGTDRSIPASTASQTLMAANPLRSRVLIRNDTTIDVWINFDGTAVATAGGGNFKIAANGGSLDLQGTSSAINIIAASGTPAISAREW